MKSVDIKIKCEDCKYFDADYQDADEQGWCRRYPPVIGGMDLDFHIFPRVFGKEDWCGEFVKKEKKNG